MDFTARSSDGGVTASARCGHERQLRDERQMVAHVLDGVAAEETRPPDAPGDAPARLLREVAGSGPWFWAGSGPLSFMRGGVLITPWGEGTWGVRRDAGGGAEHAPEDTVFADFAGSQHDIRHAQPGVHPHELAPESRRRRRRHRLCRPRRRRVRDAPVTPPVRHVGVRLAECSVGT